MKLELVIGNNFGNIFSYICTTARADDAFQNFKNLIEELGHTDNVDADVYSDPLACSPLTTEARLLPIVCMGKGSLV